MSRVEQIPCRLRQRKGRAILLPVRPVRLRPGDRTEEVRQAGRVSIVVYRASPWQRFWLKVRGKA
jgi:hypothetical protein